ncbi:hypothetical protein IJT10_08510 [bacterium]|nr:hypothetical protein [bacterium]
MYRKFTLIFTVALIIFVLGLCGCSDGGVKLEYQAKVGEVLKYKTSVSQSMDNASMGAMSMSISTNAEQKTTKVSDKEIEYEVKFISGSMEINGKKQNLPKMPTQKIVMGKSGQVISCGDGGLKNGASVLPENKVKVGDTWKSSDVIDLDKNTKLNVEYNCKLVELTKENGRDIAVIESSVVGESENDGAKMKCEGKGKTKFDYKSGVLVHGDVSQKITMSKNGMSLSFNQSMSNDLVQ